jgi:molecular chaperone GrpE
MAIAPRNKDKIYMTKKTAKPETETEPVEAETEAAETKTEEPSPAEETVADLKPELSKEDEALEKQLLRLRADFDNFRKRTLRERSDLSRRANEHIVEELLPILDHFEMGLSTAHQHEAEPSVIKGFKLVYDQFEATLKKFGVTAIEAESQPFDPHLHEAATYIPSEEHAENMVIAQTRRGYKLGDHLLRPAQVVVSSGAPAAPEAETGEDA